MRVVVWCELAMGIGIGRDIWGIKYGYPIHVSRPEQALFYPAENKQQ